MKYYKALHDFRVYTGHKRGYWECFKDELFTAKELEKLYKKPFNEICWTAHLCEVTTSTHNTYWMFGTRRIKDENKVVRVVRI